jgi:enoyl-CoA hydratase/carnithine racemase
MTDFAALTVKIVDLVATIEMASFEIAIQNGEDIHVLLGHEIEQLRENDDVRLIVITGAEDGVFLCPPAAAHLGGIPSRLLDPSKVTTLLEGLIRTHLAIAQIPKPVIARVNGDAIGFGQSIMMSCDFIVAREDALISDVHLGMGEVRRSDGAFVGGQFGITPGDGAGALVSEFLSPTRAKEYLMLSPTYTARELMNWGIINRAVAAEDLDDAVSDFTRRLLLRPATSLAWTKRMVNRRVLGHLETSLAAAGAFEMLDFQFLDRT